MAARLPLLKAYHLCVQIVRVKVSVSAVAVPGRAVIGQRWWESQCDVFKMENQEVNKLTLVLQI